MIRRFHLAFTAAFLVFFSYFPGQTEESAQPILDKAFGVKKIEAFAKFTEGPTVDRDGNLYFSHHFLKNDEMIEADFYVCYRK